MAEWWQQPYAERQAAGTVQTPGVVDWGGIYDALQAPYWKRQDREQGNAVADPITLYSKSNYVAQPKFTARDPAMMDPIELYRQAGYTAQPRFGTLPPKVASSPKVRLENPVPGPNPVPKSQDRLAPLPVGLPPGYGSDYKATPRFSTAAALPEKPGYGGYKATPRFSTASLPAKPDYGSYVASPRFGTASSGSGIIELDLDLGDRGAQGMADSEGKPVRTKSGKVYYPGGNGAVSSPGAPRIAGAAPARSGGLFSSLFGGGNSGGLFGSGSGRAPVAITVTGGNPAPAAPGPTYTTTPFQEDRFQTTTGAGMPSSMNNSRWTTGY